MTDAPDTSQRRCAVIYNPIKVSDNFRGLAEETLSRHGFAAPMWLETTIEDPGTGMARQAREAGVDLVIGAGGDGTIRLIADGLAGSDIPLGVVAAGTGNLLARNLDLPLDETTALEVSARLDTRRIDLIRLTVDDRLPEHFAVMAGVGVDAMIMEETDSNLKDLIGAGAYVFAARKAIKKLPLKVTVCVDQRRPLRRQSMLCLIGNVGELQGKVRLIADAEPDDGLLDVYIASPQRLSHWFKIVLRMVTRRAQKDDRVDQLKGRTATITIDGSDNYQLDGDVVGSCHTLRAEIRPGALSVCVPVADP